MATNDQKNEPQSYGSQHEWVKGKTPQKVNPDAASPAPPQAEFYAPHRDSEENGPQQGGLVSPVQAAEADLTGTRAIVETETTGHKVNGEESGAKRGSFFRNRDYRPE
jgi:hypothetical protein